MSPPPHLEIFTADHATSNGESSFCLFSQLPKEIRQKIWQHSLHRQRIIHVCLEHPTKQTAAQAADSSSPNPKSERYRAIVDGYQVLSKLLRVNSDSREATLAFYRVHLPCTFRRGRSFEWTKAPGIFHFNPEYDFLHISPEPRGKDVLVDFLYDLKTNYDLHQVGLRNLAVDESDLWSALDLGQAGSFDVDSDARTAFVDIIMQLQEVFFISAPRTGRQILGLISGLPTSEILFNRSLPIIAKAPSFKRLQRDPRLIAGDLKKIFVEMFAPYRIFEHWTEMLKKWGVSPVQIEYRFLLGFDPGKRYQVIDHESANRWLQIEDDHWNSTFGLSSTKYPLEKKEEMENGPFSDIKWPVRSLPEKFRNEDLSQAVKPAFGYWLFPIEAIRSFAEEGSSDAAGIHYKAGCIMDMTKHWPELLLIGLS